MGIRMHKLYTLFEHRKGMLDGHMWLDLLHEMHDTSGVKGHI